MTHALPISTSAVPAPAPASSPLSVVPGPGDLLETPTISGAEMSRLTGVDRERLRTWERRHGFPVPLRRADNVRRYRAADVRIVSAVARLAERGVPLAEAIPQALREADAPATLSLGTGLERMPAPTIAVRGPRPLELAWHNGAAQAAADAPRVGDDLAAGPHALGATAQEAIRQLMAGETDGPQLFACRDWMGAAADCHVMAWRAEVETGAPVVILTQVPSAGAPTTAAPARSDEANEWVHATAAARAVLRRGGGLASLQRALGVAVQQLGATDAVLGIHRGGTIRLARSVRGQVAPLAAELADAADLSDAIAVGQVSWLGLRTRAALGIDARHHLLAVPIMSADQSLGAALFVFGQERALCPVTGELLLGLGSALATTLERERCARLAAAE